MPEGRPPSTLIITIDGPAGTGKSTVAHRLADQLEIDYLDTGSMYRTSALVAIQRDLDPADGPALDRLKLHRTREQKRDGTTERELSSLFTRLMMDRVEEHGQAPGPVQSRRMTRR